MRYSAPSLVFQNQAGLRLEAGGRDAAERALIELVGAGAVRREALADDALWQIA